MAARLADYLANLDRSRPAHCGAFLCGWVAEATGQHPAPGVGDLTTHQWARLLRRSGGLVRLLSERGAQRGATLTKAPQPGDVGVVMAPTCERRGRVRPVCAIRTAKGWAIWSGTGGLMAAPVQALRAWRVV